MLGQADHYIEDACDCSKGTLGSPYSVYLRDLQWCICLFLLHRAQSGSWPAKNDVEDLVVELLDSYVDAIGEKPFKDVVDIRPINYWVNPPKVGSFKIKLSEKKHALSTGRYAEILSLLRQMDWPSLSAQMDAATAAYKQEISQNGYDSAFVALSKDLYSLIKARCHDPGMNCGTCDEAVKNGGDCFTSYHWLPLAERTNLLTPIILEQFGQIYALIDELFHWWKVSSTINQ